MSARLGHEVALKREDLQPVFSFKLRGSVQQDGAALGRGPGERRGGRFCQSLGKRSVTEFNYRFAGGDQAHVYVGLQIRAGEHRGCSTASNFRNGPVRWRVF